LIVDLLILNPNQFILAHPPDTLLTQVWWKPVNAYSAYYHGNETPTQTNVRIDDI